MSYGDYQPRQKVTFPPNIPTQIQLASEGEPQENKAGETEYRYFLSDHKIAWLPAEVHAAIQRAGAGEGDTIVVTKQKAGKAAPTWAVETYAEEPAAAALRAAETAPASRAPSPQQQRAAAPQQPAAPQPAAQLAADAPELPTTAADQLAAALLIAIDQATEAEAYARRKGLPVRWTSEDLRCMAITVYLEHARGGRR